jgi:hypothetical protein
MQSLLGKGSQSSAKLLLAALIWLRLLSRERRGSATKATLSQQWYALIGDAKPFEASPALMCSDGPSSAKPGFACQAGYCSAWDYCALHCLLGMA